MEEILSLKVAWGKLYYQVRWKGWDPDPQWYLAGLFKNSASLLKVYHDQYPDKAGPPMRLQQWLRAAEEDRFKDDHEDDHKPAVDGGTTALRRSNRKKKG